jgi:sigma-B regulation protein RsbU (phosphoserine phosphatase)
MSMLSNRAKQTGAWISRNLARLREWLRGVMPRVALVAGALFLLRLLARNTGLYASSFGNFLRILTVFAVTCTLVYYGLKILVRLKRLLLWRVRRRLIITYLFVGLTPIILLLVLGFLAALGSASQGMVRVVTVEVNTTKQQTLESARTLTGVILKSDVNGDGGRNAQRTLDERADLIRSALPGARVDVWRARGTEDAAKLGHTRNADLTSIIESEQTRGVGVVPDTPGAPLPAWLEGRDEWSGFAYLATPADSENAFGTPSVRAFVRKSESGRTVVVLVAVPVSRALLREYRANTGVNVRPFFLAADSGPNNSDQQFDASFKIGDQRSRDENKPGAITFTDNGRVKSIDVTRDQFGDPLPDKPGSEIWYPVFLDSTDWNTGYEDAKWAFMIDWSWSAFGSQLWSDTFLGPTLRDVLFAVGLVFLILELFALFSAAWMTRAVTGTVHKLYRATEFIKRGDFSHRIRTRSRDQLGELALAFNEMSANIEGLLAEGIEHERLKREVEIAHEVQAQLFPRSVPQLSSGEITGECRAARGIAGDYYDYIEIVPGLIACALGDVSGKGISASLVMSNLQAALRAQTAIISERLRIASAATASSAQGAATAVTIKRGDGHVRDGEAGFSVDDANHSVASMTESINAQLYASTDGNRFVTLFLALYDDRKRTLCYTNAGHNAPALLRPDGTVERLTAGGTMVGAFEWARFEEAQASLNDGDLLLVFSDGLSEAQNEAGEEYGESRLIEFAASHRHESAESIRRAVFEEIDRWSGATERNDDQTLVILKIASS